MIIVTSSHNRPDRSHYLPAGLQLQILQVTTRDGCQEVKMTQFLCTVWSGGVRVERRIVSSSVILMMNDENGWRQQE